MRVNFLNFIPVCFALFLLGFLYISLNQKTSLPTSLQGMSINEFELPSERENIFFSSKELTGQWALLNIWATWCSACEIEHETLKEIAQFIPIYGISYRDERKSVQAWLKKYGNPYRKIGLDESGQVLVEMGVMGTPETYLIDPDGRVRYRHVGVLTKQDWQQYFLPILKRK